MSGLTGFTKAVKSDKKRLILSLEGQEKMGKTTFALSAPGPIALFDLDIGLEGVLDKVIGKKEIYVASFDYRDATNQQEWLDQWEALKKAYYSALKDKEIRTLVIDTASELWELVRLARFGKLAQVQPHHYGPVNTEFRDFLRKAYDVNKNLILLHKRKAEYVNNQKTGGMERAGFSDIGYLVQVNIICWRDVEGDGFGLTVKDCRQTPELAGYQMTEPMNTFPFLAAMVLPETSPDDWM